VVNTALLLSALFIDRDQGYYYYGPGYGGRTNFYPWYAGYGRGVYSPLYSFYSWQLGRESDHWQDRFDVRRRNGRDGDRNFDGPQPRLVGTVEDVRRSIEQDDSRNGGDPRSRFQQLTEVEREASRERARNMDQFRSARARFEAENNNVRDRLENTRGQGQNRSREARVNVPKNYQPPTFDLQTVEGAAQLRRQAQARFEQQVVRQNGDESRSDNRVEPRPRDVQGANDARLRGARGNRQPNRTEQFNRPNVRSNQQPPAAPRNLQIERRGNRQGEANRGSSTAGRAERSRGNGNGNGGNASEGRGNSTEKPNRGAAGGGGNKTGGGNRGGGGKGK
jgi:hypothetical protein